MLSLRLFYVCKDHASDQEIINEVGIGCQTAERLIYFTRLNSYQMNEKEREMHNQMAFPLLFFIFVVATGFAAATPQQNQESKVELAYPTGELGNVVKLGEDIVNRTSEHRLSRQYVGNKLNCTSCHLEAGRHKTAGSFLGTAAAYPAWSPREERVITLEDRVLNCFMRSQNGIRPPNGSQVSVAVTTYITWLSQGSMLQMNGEKPLGPNHTPQLNLDGLKPNPQRGSERYANQCADCHGADGIGSDDGPPVWGKDSYNDGAGLSRVPKLASWLKEGMPLDDATLTTQEALDIAAFINSHERPKFNLSEHLPEDKNLGEYNGNRQLSEPNQTNQSEKE